MRWRRTLSVELERKLDAWNIKTSSHRSFRLLLRLCVRGPVRQHRTPTRFRSVLIWSRSMYQSITGALKEPVSWWSRPIGRPHLQCNDNVVIVLQMICLQLDVQLRNRLPVRTDLKEQHHLTASTVPAPWEETGTLPFISSVCLWAGYLEKLWTDFDETW